MHRLRAKFDPVFAASKRYEGVLDDIASVLHRLQLIQLIPGYRPDEDSDDYNALATNHGAVMIFWVAMPVLIAALGNYLIPLMIGCDDMVFPRLNRLSYQLFLISSIVPNHSFFLHRAPFGAAWASHPPTPLHSMPDYATTIGRLVARLSSPRSLPSTAKKSSPIRRSSRKAGA